MQQKQAAADAVQQQVQLLKQDQLKDVGTLQEECAELQMKLQVANKGLQEAQADITRMQVYREHLMLVSIFIYIIQVMDAIISFTTVHCKFRISVVSQLPPYNVLLHVN